MKGGFISYSYGCAVKEGPWICLYDVQRYRSYLDQILLYVLGEKG